MSNNIVLTCVLPSYNGEKMIDKAIESILSQTFQNFELIIVDDCSKDNTAKVAEKYLNDNRVRIIKNKENLTLPVALNIGFENAKGKYYTWTSDDNILKPKAFEALIEYLDKNLDVGIVYGKYDRYIYETGQKKGTTKIHPQSHLPFKCICGAYFMYRKKVHEKNNGYRKELFYAEDWDFWLRSDLNGFKIKGINVNHYDYYYHNNSLTLTGKDRVYSATKKAVSDYISKKKNLSKFDKAIAIIANFRMKTKFEEKKELWQKMMKESGFFWIILAALRMKRLIRVIKYYFKYVR